MFGRSISNQLKVNTAHFLRIKFARFLRWHAVFRDDRNMPQVICEVFATRVQKTAALERVLHDLGMLTGVNIRFYATRGTRGENQPSTCKNHSVHCQRLALTERGRQFCRSACLRFFAEGREKAITTRCTVGTTFCAVPIRSSVGLLGYLVAAGFYERRPGMREMNRVRHLLEREGFQVDRSELAKDCAKTKIFPANRLVMLRRLMEMSAGYLVKELSMELFQAGGDLPKPILRACQIIRERFRDDPTQEEIARAVGLSTTHFSRLFHRRTGLRYKEYVNEIRLQQARRELRETEESVTQVAFDAGFRSISQFNRQFKSHYGTTPRAYRRRYR